MEKERREEREMFKIPWSQKTVEQKIKTIAIMLAVFFGTMVIAYAISNYLTTSFVITTK